MNTTVMDRPITFDFNQLAEEWSKPKTLMEIYGLVGRFPFFAKAVVFSSAKTSVPVGETVDITGFGENILLEPGFETNWRPHDANSGVLIFIINPNIRRWLLVED